MSKLQAKNDRPEWVEEDRQLVERSEMQADVAAFDEAISQLNSGDDELIPEHIANRLLAGENPIRVWRDYRNITQIQLAKQLEISAGYLSQLETGQRTGTADLFARLAQALHIDIEDLLT